MKWLRRKSNAPAEPKRPGIWVWRQNHLVSDWYVTRFFFTEEGFLDLPDMMGEGAKKFMAAFAHCPRVINVNPHESYMAVHWESASPKLSVDAQRELDAIVEAGIAVLANHFGWNKDTLRTGEISSDDELWQLRKSEGLSSDNRRWIIGRG